LNIFSTPQFINPTQGNLIPAEGVSEISNQQAIDPELLKLLETESTAKGINFDEVLAATKKGQDPEAVMKLLEENKKGQTNTDKPEAESLVGDQKNVAEKSNKNEIVKEVNSPAAKELKALLSEDTPKNVQKLEKNNLVLAKNDLNEAAKSGNEFLNKKMISEPTVQTKHVTAAMLALEGQNQLSKNAAKTKIIKTSAKNNAQPINNAQLVNNQIAGKEVVTEGKSVNNLLNLNDFMQKQSPTMKANAAKKAYKPVSESMFSQKIEQDLPGVIRKSANTEVTMKDVLLGNTQDPSQEQLAQQFNSNPAGEQLNKLDKINSTTKVFDLNSMGKTSSTDEVIGKVQDYIIQSKVSNQPEVQVAFKHDDLGVVDLTVKKVNTNQLDIIIHTNKIEGSEFFAKNKMALLTNLSHSGVQVGDLKLESSAQSNNQNQDSSRQQSFAQSKGGNHNSESGQKDSDSRRREDLWNQHYEKEVA
jgi:hypothetical protein